MQQKPDLTLLTKCAQSCDLCARMAGRTKVLSELNGNTESKVLFVAEAPGRLGADRTATPLSGDVAGRNFERLLSVVGWDRKSVFITNAVLCNPRCDNGNNATPTEEEIENCSHLLRMSLSLVKPSVVVTLGATALKALKMIQPHPYELRRHVGSLVDWWGYKLFVAYHTGQRAVVHRSVANQTADFYKLAKVVDPIKGLLPNRRRRVSRGKVLRPRLGTLANVIHIMIRRLGQLSKFRLVKLLYLCDLSAYEQRKETVTGIVYLRQKDGPWPPDIDDALEYMADHEIEIRFSRNMPIVRPGPNPRMIPQLADEDMRLVYLVCEKFGQLTNAGIKSVAYRSGPMKDVLRAERLGERRINSVILK